MSPKLEKLIRVSPVPHIVCCIMFFSVITRISSHLIYSLYRLLTSIQTASYVPDLDNARISINLLGTARLGHIVVIEEGPEYISGVTAGILLTLFFMI